ncbi:unnamed protein product [Victoria cruziana]
MPAKSSFAQKLLHDIRKKKERSAGVNNTDRSSSFLALGPKHDDHNRFSLGSDHVEPYHTSRSLGKDNRFRDSGTGRHSKLLLTTTDTTSSKEMVVYHQKDNPAASTAGGPWLPDATIVAIQILTRRRNRDSDFSRKELLEINPINGRIGESVLHADPSCSGRVLSSSFLEAKGPESLSWVLESTAFSGLLCSDDGRSIDSDSRLLDGTRDLGESLQTLVHLLETSEQVVTPRTESDRKQIPQPGSIEALVSRLQQKDGGLPLDRLLKRSHGDSRMLGAGIFGGRKPLSLPPPETKQLPHNPLHINNGDAFSARQGLPAPQRSNSSSAASNGYSDHPTKEGHKIKPFGSRGSQQEKARIPNVIAKLMGLEELPADNVSVGAKIQKTPDAKEPISETKSSIYQRDESITKLNSILLNSQNALLKIDFRTRMQQMDGRATVERKAKGRGPTARMMDHTEESYAKESQVEKKPSQTVKNNQQKNIQNTYHAGGAKTTLERPAREIRKGKVDDSTTLTAETMQQHVQKPVPGLGVEGGYLVYKSLKSNTQKAELEAAAVDGDLRSKTRGSQAKTATVRAPSNEVTHLRAYEKSFPQHVAEAKDAVHNEGKIHGTMSTNQKKEQSSRDGVSRPSVCTPKHMKGIERPNNSHTAEFTDPQVQDRKNQNKAKVDGRHGSKNRRGELGLNQETATNNLNKSYRAARKLEKQEIMHTTGLKASSEAVTPVPFSVLGKQPIVIPPKTAALKESHLKEAPSSKRKGESSSSSLQRPKLCQEMPAEHKKTSLAQELKQRRRERMIEMANVRRGIEGATRNLEVPSTSSGVIAAEEISHHEIQPESEIKLNNTDVEREAANLSLPDSPTDGNMPAAVRQEETTRDLPTRRKAHHLPRNTEHQQAATFKLKKRSGLTEEENQLKQILITNPALLHAANALFDIYVPAGIVGTSYLKGTKDHGGQLVDCVEELMRRKSRWGELSLHHSNRFSKYSKILSFNGLVKGLNEDLNSLNVHGDHGWLKPADYLNKLIEKDIRNSRPHTSCLWDMDWFEGLFAEERERIAREVEMHILDELLKEVTDQLYS